MNRFHYIHHIVVSIVVSTIFLSCSRDIDCDEFTIDNDIFVVNTDAIYPIHNRNYVMDSENHEMILELTSRGIDRVKMSSSSQNNIRVNILPDLVGDFVMIDGTWYNRHVNDDLFEIYTFENTQWNVSFKGYKQTLEIKVEDLSQPDYIEITLISNYEALNYSQSTFSIRYNP